MEGQLMIRIAESTEQEFERKHFDVVRRVGAECTLFLAADERFPLDGACRMAAYGSGVRHTIKGGTGSGDVNVRHFTTIEEGLTKAGFSVVTGEWLDGYDKALQEAKDAFYQGIRDEAKRLNTNPVFLGMGRTMADPVYDAAVDVDADAAIYVVSRNSGEGADRQVKAGDIELTEAEIRDILAVNEKYERFMLVLNTGGLVDLTPVRGVRNILLLGQLGMATGDVLADILLGKSYPSGKLSMTWAPIAAYPSTEGFGDMDDTVYNEGIYVGYRYFDTKKVEVTYPFGFGLGYTSFDIDAKASSENGRNVTVEAVVSNTGKHAGKEVVQVYVSAPEGTELDQPYQVLACFGKTKELKPGESETLKLAFDMKDLAGFDEKSGQYILEKGTYTVRAGSSSQDTKTAGTVEASEIRFVPGEGRSAKKPSAGPGGEKFSFNEVMEGKRTAAEFASTLTDEQLAQLCTGYHKDQTEGGFVIGQASLSLAGGAGDTTERLKDLDVPALNMADGPAGLRVSTSYKQVGDMVKPVSNALESLLAVLDPDGLQQLKDSMPAPTKEEEEAPLYYQYCTAIPIGTALAQSWSTEAVEECGDLVGSEMEQFGIDIWLAPAMNIHRSPLCGRNFEYYSEDPLLTGLIAAAMNRGVHGHPGRATTIKHFACNNQETNRYVSNSVLSERALREIYLKGFEICIRECAPYALMTSYNLVNGEHSCTSEYLLNEILRGEWGYEGLVMTDWVVTRDDMLKASSRKNKYTNASAAGCVKAGNDLVMPGAVSDVEDILKGLTDGSHPYAITRAELELAAAHVLELIVKLRNAR